MGLESTEEESKEWRKSYPEEIDNRLSYPKKGSRIGYNIKRGIPILENVYSTDEIWKAGGMEIDDSKVPYDIRHPRLTISDIQAFAFGNYLSEIDLKELTRKDDNKELVSDFKEQINEIKYMKESLKEKDEKLYAYMLSYVSIAKTKGHRLAKKIVARNKALENLKSQYETEIDLIKKGKDVLINGKSVISAGALSFGTYIITKPIIENEYVRFSASLIALGFSFPFLNFLETLKIRGITKDYHKKIEKADKFFETERGKIFTQGIIDTVKELKRCVPEAVSEQ